MSAFSGDEAFSAPEEKSRSNLRGVVKAGLPKMASGRVGEDCGGGWEKRKVCELGSLRAGKGFFVGESKMLCGPGLAGQQGERKGIED